MTETDFNGEFGWELLKAIPYAYNLHLKGQLQKTTSCLDTRCLYYFSKNHVEKHKVRRGQSGTKWSDPLPFNSIHRPNPPDRKHWTPPSYKTFFKDRLKQERPTVVISNKFNSEWGGNPINFLTEEAIVQMVESLKDRFKVYYNRPTKLIADNSQIFDLKEKDAVKKAGATLLEEEYETHKEKMTFNTFQMAVFAGSELFVSVQGGTSILSSYFGGTNLILAKRGQELGCNSYSWYPHLSGCKIGVFKEEKRIVETIRSI